MKDLLAQLDHLEKQTAECEMIATLATDPGKREMFKRLGNGLSTNLTPSAPTAAANALVFDDLPSPLAAALPSTKASGEPTIEDRLKQQRLEQLERANREGRRQEALAAGRLIEAGSARQLVGREVSRLVTEFEGALSTFATAISAQFKLPQRDVLHLLRSEFRKVRAAAAASARASASALPEVVEIDLDRFGEDD